MLTRKHKHHATVFKISETEKFMMSANLSYFHNNSIRRIWTRSFWCLCCRTSKQTKQSLLAQSHRTQARKTSTLYYAYIADVTNFPGKRKWTSVTHSCIKLFGLIISHNVNSTQHLNWQRFPSCIYSSKIEVASFVLIKNCKPPHLHMLELQLAVASFKQNTRIYPRT